MSTPDFRPGDLFFEKFRLMERRLEALERARRIEHSSIRLGTLTVVAADDQSEVLLEAGVLSTGGSGLRLAGLGIEVIDDIAVRNAADFGDPTGGGDPGPAITVRTGQRAIILLGASVTLNNATNRSCTMSYAISGATTSAADADVKRFVVMLWSGAAGTTIRASLARAYVENNLTPGVNTFTAKYNSGGDANCQWNDRFIAAIPI